MPSLSSTIPLSLALAGWWLPVLGLLLAGLGAALVATAVGDLVAPVRATTRSIAGTTVSVESRIAGRAVLTAPVGRGTEAEAGETVRIAPGRRERGRVTCLGADLATGRRAESAHLATVALLRRADRGDARDAILGLAALPHMVPARASWPPSWSRVDRPQLDGIDLVAAALYGPPDRQPPAKHKEEVIRDGGRGLRARLSGADRGSTSC